ncbi:hypothetical protein [Thermovibrio ammonificans]
MLSLLKKLKLGRRSGKSTTVVDKIEEVLSPFEREPFLAVVLLDGDGLQLYSYEPKALFKGDYLQRLFKVFDFFDRELKESFSLEAAVKLADILQYKSRLVVVYYGSYKFILARRNKLFLIMVLPGEEEIELKRLESEVGSALEKCEELLKDAI